MSRNQKKKKKKKKKDQNEKMEWNKFKLYVMN